MNQEITTIDDEVREFLATKGTPDPDYEEWAKAEIDRRMAAKARGENTYRSLDEVMADYGFDAR